MTQPGDKSLLEAITVEQLEVLLRYWQRSSNPRAPVFIERVGAVVRQKQDKTEAPP